MASKEASKEASLGTFLALGISPWSYRARWVLAHHGHTYVEKEYRPLVSEPFLRIRLGFRRGKITAPIFFPSDRGQKALCDSSVIARYADAHRATGESLFPKDKDAELQEWAEAAERCMEYERRKTMQEIVDGTHPVMSEGGRPVGKMAEKMFRIMTKMWFMKKYDMDGGGLEEVRKDWQKIQEKTKEVGPDGYLVGGKFSYADILVATASTLVKNVDPKYYPSTPNKDGNEELEKEIQDVVLWRDRIFEKHFPAALVSQ